MNVQQLFLLACDAEDCMEKSLITDHNTTCPVCGEPLCVVNPATADDIAEAWGNDLESANRHGMTEMPQIILGTLEHWKVSKSKVLGVMTELYEKRIGV